ncbi:MAG: S8 family serine peptidase, partial [Thermoleophilia bacterium]|nr:S8 family serine peptidase [Thermoleophilia bacterium]
AVAGVALARGHDAVGMAGVAWNVKIMPIKIATYGQTDDIILAQAIYWAVDHGADVINISFGGASYTVLEQEAVNYALSHRVVVVASAGNSGSDGVCYPAALPGVIAVGATDQANARPDFSATGVGLDLVAPGTEIGSYPLDSSTGSWRLWSGTSFSAPIVSGTAALLLSLKPTLTPGEMADI